MSSHDTLQVASHTASAATHALIIAQASDLVLQACGLGSAQSPDQFSQIQQGESTPRRRGRTPQVGWTQLWSSLLLCAREAHALICGLASPARLAASRPVCPCLAHTQWPGQTAPSRADLVPLQELWEGINAQLAQTGSQAVPATLATFATDILCLDETRLDAVGRYLKPLRGLSAHDSACTALKLVALFDLRGKPVAATRMARGGA